MTVRPEVLILILSCALVTLMPRVLPLLLLSKVEIPDGLRNWLSFVPVTALAALIGAEVFYVGGKFSIGLQNPGFMATIPTLLVALCSRNVLITVGSGLFFFYGFSHFPLT